MEPQGCLCRMGRHLLSCSAKSTISAVDNAAKQGSLCSNSPFPGDTLSLASGLSTNHTASLSVLAQGVFSVYFFLYPSWEAIESLVCCLFLSSALVAPLSTVESPACGAVPSLATSVTDAQLPEMLTLQGVTGNALSG